MFNLYQFLGIILEINMFGKKIIFTNMQLSMLIALIILVLINILYTRSNVVKLFSNFIFDLVQSTVAVHVEKPDIVVKPMFILFLIIIILNLVGAFSFFPMCSFPVFTGILSGSVFFISVFAGLYKKKFGFFVDIVPKDVPLLMKPFLFIVEFFSFMIKPIILTVRLCLNLIMGHIILDALIVLAKSFGKASIILMPILLLVQIIEMGISLLQAYLFITFSSIIVGTCLNKGH